MNEIRKVTGVADIAPPPFEIIALQFLKDSGGQPVCIRVNPLGPLAISKAVGMLPGAIDPDAVESGLSQTEQMVQVWEMMAPYAPPLIEAACEPPISFTTPTPEGCVPAGWLRDIELMQLVLAIVNVSGFTGGAAEDAVTFLRGGDGAAGGEATPGECRIGTVDAEQGDRDEAVGVVRPAHDDVSRTDASTGFRCDDTARG